MAILKKEETLALQEILNILAGVHGESIDDLFIQHYPYNNSVGFFIHKGGYGSEFGILGEYLIDYSASDWRADLTEKLQSAGISLIQGGN